MTHTQLLASIGALLEAHSLTPNYLTIGGCSDRFLVSMQVSGPDLSRMSRHLSASVSEVAPVPGGHRGWLALYAETDWGQLTLTHHANVCEVRLDS